MVFVASSHFSPETPPTGALDIDPADVHHLTRVLRLELGEPVAASDGRGSWRMCSFAPPARLVPTGPVMTAEAPTPAIAVGFVPTKGERPEWTVQKLTELGVDRIVVVASGRSVVHWRGDRADRHLQKLREVSRQAAMQSRRVFLPTVEGVVELEDLAAGRYARAGAEAIEAPEAPAVDPGVRWLLAVPGGQPPALVAPTAAAVPGIPAPAIGVLVGPEGGWTPEEQRLELPTVGLGDGVLRAETAALAAGALLTSLRAGLVAPADDPGEPPLSARASEA